MALKACQQEVLKGVYVPDKVLLITLKSVSGAIHTTTNNNKHAIEAARTCLKIYLSMILIKVQNPFLNRIVLLFHYSQLLLKFPEFLFFHQKLHKLCHKLTMLLSDYGQ